jgi:hypothetical protein
VFRIGLPRHCASTRCRSSSTPRQSLVRLHGPFSTPVGPGRSPARLGNGLALMAVVRGSAASRAMPHVTCTPLISFRFSLRISIRASALPPCFGSRSGHGLQPFLAGSSSPPEYAACFVPSSRRALCAAALTALLLTRIDPGATCSASVRWRVCSRRVSLA